MGYMETRIHKELKNEEITLICETYHSWQKNLGYKDILGFCKSLNINELSKDASLAPGHYVGTNKSSVIDTDFNENIETLCAELLHLLDESKALESKIKNNLKSLILNS